MELVSGVGVLLPEKPPAHRRPGLRADHHHRSEGQRQGQHRAGHAPQGPGPRGPGLLPEETLGVPQQPAPPPAVGPGGGNVGRRRSQGLVVIRRRGVQKGPTDALEFLQGFSHGIPPLVSFVGGVSGPGSPGR